MTGLLTEADRYKQLFEAGVDDRRRLIGELRALSRLCGLLVPVADAARTWLALTAADDLDYISIKAATEELAAALDALDEPTTPEPGPAADRLGPAARARLERLLALTDLPIEMKPERHFCDSCGTVGPARYEHVRWTCGGCKTAESKVDLGRRPVEDIAVDET